jgi:hypothetical protein
VHEPEAEYESEAVQQSEAVSEPALEPEPEVEPPVEPELEAALEPAPEPEPLTEPEPEPALPPAAVWTDYGRHTDGRHTDGREDVASERAVDDSAAEDTSGYDSSAEDTARVAETSTEQSVEHVVMLATAAGYRIVIADGAQPTPTVEVDGVIYDVSGRMSSPFPGDTRTAFFASRSDSAATAASY